MKKAIATILIIITAFTLSCEKVAVDCDYTIKAWERLHSKDKDGVALFGAQVYAFLADTTDWTVASYEDAMNGVIRSKSNGETKNYDYKGSTNDGHAFKFNFTKKGVMVVIASADQPMYAFGNPGITDNLDKVDVNIVFNRYLKDTVEYQSKGVWKKVYGKTNVPTNCEYTLKTMQIREETASAVPLKTSHIRAHVFYGADTTRWKVLSHKDAVDGVLSPVEGFSGQPPAKEDIEIIYEAGDKNNDITTTLTADSVMLVVYDIDQPMFGYSSMYLTDKPLNKSETITFLPYKQDMTYKSDRTWYITNEATEVNSEVVVNTGIREGRFSPVKPLSSVRTYAFFVDDLSEWEVKSHSDALAGIITKKDNAEIITANYDIEGSIDNTGAIHSFILREKPVLFIVCHTDKPIYAVMGSELNGWPELIVENVVFKPYLTERSYTEDGWAFVNEDITEEGPE